MHERDLRLLEQCVPGGRHGAVPISRFTKAIFFAIGSSCDSLAARFFFWTAMAVSSTLPFTSRPT